MTITGNDLNLTEAFIDKFADSPEQADAVKKVLGFNKEAESVSIMYTPDSPPPAPHVCTIDPIEHGRSFVKSCEDRVNRFGSDNDPMPLAERSRLLILARRDLARLEAKNATTNG